MAAGGLLVQLSSHRLARRRAVEGAGVPRGGERSAGAVVAGARGRVAAAHQPRVAAHPGALGCACRWAHHRRVAARILAAGHR